MARFCKFTKEQITFSTYPNGRTCILIMNEVECVAKATVNIPVIPLQKDEVLIKDYSENQGIFQDLIEMGVIVPPITKIHNGFVEVYKCKLSEESKKYK